MCMSEEASTSPCNLFLGRWTYVGSQLTHLCTLQTELQLWACSEMIQVVVY